MSTLFHNRVDYYKVQYIITFKNKVFQSTDLFSSKSKKFDSQPRSSCGCSGGAENGAWTRAWGCSGDQEEGREDIGRADRLHLLEIDILYSKVMSH